MENNNVEKQNGALKVVLLILLIIGVSAASIAGYHYYPVLFKNTEPWEKADSSKRDRSGTRSDRPATTAPAPATAPAAPAPAATNQSAPAAQPTQASLQGDAAMFTGAWEFRGANGANHRRTYNTPSQQGSSYVGDVTDENGVTFANYTVEAGNKLTLEILVTNALNNAGEKNTYTYKFSNNGKTFTLSRNGGVLSTWQRQ